MKFIDKIFPLLIAVSLVTTGPLFSQMKMSDFRFQSPNLIEMRSGGDFEIPVEVIVANNHHIYIDHVNSLSFNILTDFSVDEKSGFVLDIQTKPQAQKKGNDMILEGKGRTKPAGKYNLLLSEIQGRKKSQKIHIVRLNIKTQLCDTKKDICFAPQDFKRTLRVRIHEDRVAKRSRALIADNILDNR